MTELWLKLTDSDGEPRRVIVDRERFVIGRHSDCDLTIADPRLSRQHAKIETFATVYEISDEGSSNGTEVNGTPLTGPKALKNGDIISFGGFEATVEFASDAGVTKKTLANGEKSADTKSAQPKAAAVSDTGGGSIPTAVFIAAPLLALALVICGAGALFYTRSNERAGQRQNPGETPVLYVIDPPADSPATTKSPNETATPSVSPVPSGSNPPATPELSDEKKKIEVNSAAFLRSIAMNDPSAYLKSAEIELVSARMNQLKGSGALAENLRSVKNNAAQFQTMAQSKGLKPQFLAAAALAELGSNRGNPVETAQRMLPVFVELRVSLANNLADDNLLMMAAYNQGTSGQFKALRNTLEALAKKNKGVSPREIRTIWFLKKQGKLTDSEFDFAIRFIAAGTILQNPKDFSVNAETASF